MCEILDRRRNKHYLNFPALVNETKSILTLNIFYININRLANKLDELEVLLASLNETVDVIVLTETFLSKTDTQYINLNGYKAFHSVRESRTGGGVSIFCHDNLDFTLLSDEIHDENQCLIVCSRKLNFNIAGIYKPPHSNSKTFLSFLDRIASSNKNQIIVILNTYL